MTLNEKKLAMRVKTVSEAEQVARDRIAGRKTDDLIRDFIMTNLLFDPHIPTIRGWIMDELEKRNPEAFKAWIMQDEPDDRQLPAFFRWRTRRNGNGDRKSTRLNSSHIATSRMPSSA